MRINKQRQLEKRARDLTFNHNFQVINLYRGKGGYTTVHIFKQKGNRGR